MSPSFELPPGPGSTPAPEQKSLETPKPIPAEAPEQKERRGVVEVVKGAVEGSAKSIKNVTASIGKKMDIGANRLIPGREERRSFEKGDLTEIEQKLIREKSIDDIHDIEKAFGNDGGVGLLIANFLEAGSDTEALLKNTEENFREQTGKDASISSDSYWMVQNESGERFRVERFPLKTGDDDTPHYAMRILRANDDPPIKSKGVSAQVGKIPEPEANQYGNRLVKELAGGKELTPGRLEYLFRDLIHRGAESSIAQLGAQVEGFKNFQQAMLKMDKDSIFVEETGQLIERKTDNPLDTLLEKIPNRPLRETIRSTAKSGLVSAGALAAISLVGGPVSWTAFGSAMVGSGTARWIASHYAREKKLFRPQGSDGKGKVPADEAFDTFLKKIAGAHKAALEAEKKLGEVSEELKTAERMKAMQQIIKNLRERDTGALQQFHKADKAASRVETGASLVGAMLGSGVSAYREGIHKIAEAGTQDFSAGSNLTRDLHSQWYYRHELAKTVKDQVVMIGGALGAGTIWNSLKAGGAGFWNRKEAERGLAQAQSQAKKLETSIRPEESPKNQAELVTNTVAQQVSANLELALASEMKGKGFLGEIKTGKGSYANDSITLRTVDWLLGGFANRDEIIAQLPSRLAYAEEWLKEKSESPLGVEERKQVIEIEKTLDVIRKETEGGVKEQFQQLSDQILAKTLREELKDVDDFLFNRPVPDWEVIDKREFLEAVALRAGVTDSDKADYSQLFRLEKFLQLRDDLDEPHDLFRDKLIKGVRGMIEKRKLNEVEEKRKAPQPQNRSNQGGGRQGGGGRRR